MASSEIATSSVGAGAGAEPTRVEVSAIPSAVSTQGKSISATQPRKSVISQVRRLMLVVKLAWYFYWNLPGFINIVSALRLPKTGRCRIIGYHSKFVYAYPLIPAGITIWVLSMLGVSQFATSVGYSVLMICMLLVMGEDIRGRSFWAVLGFLAAIAAVCFALVWTGVSIGGYIMDALLFFAPSVNPGFCLLLSTVLVPLMALAYIRARANNCLLVKGNNFISNTLESQLDYPIAEWRLRSAITDILESVWMGGRELKLISNFAGRGGRASAGRDNDDAGEGRAEFHLPNVPGGGSVEDLILEALEVFDVKLSDGNSGE